MPTEPQMIVLLGLVAGLSGASLGINWLTLRHLRRAARKAVLSPWSLHASALAAPDARGRLFYLRLLEPRTNRYRVGSIRVRSPARAGVSAVEYRSAGPGGASGYRHLSFKRALSLNHEIADRRIYEAGAGDPPGEGRVYFFVTPRPAGLWRRRLPGRLVVEIEIEEVAPARAAHRVTLTSDPVDWTPTPDPAPSA